MSEASRPHVSPAIFWRVWEKAWWFFAIAFCAGFFYFAFRNPRLLVGLMGSTLFLAGGITLLVAWKGRKLARESPFWPTVPGRILESKIVRETTTSGVGSRADTMTTCFPEIEYEYDYQGEHFRSLRVLLVDVNFPEAEALAAVARYPAGSSAVVYVNPQRPGIATLEPGLIGHEAKYRLPFIVGGGLSAVGIAALAASFWLG